MKLSNKLLTLAVLQMFVMHFFAQEVTFEKDYSFSVDATALLDVESVFTDVFITSWDKNKVSVHVYAKTEANSESRAQKMMDRITISVGESKRGVNINVSFKGNNQSNDKEKYDVRIEVKAPATMAFNFDCQFGDCIIPNWDGALDMDFQFGDLEMKNVTGNKCDIKLQYSDFDIGEVNDLNITSSFSDVFIDRVDDLEIDSQYDDVEIGRAVNMTADFQFSDLEVGAIVSNLLLDTQYGSVKIDRIYKEFEEIVIDNQFGDVVLDFDDAAGYEINVDISFASFNSNLKSKLNHDKTGFNENSYNGTIGDGKGRVEINSSFGGIRIR